MNGASTHFYVSCLLPSLLGVKLGQCVLRNTAPLSVLEPAESTSSTPTMLLFLGYGAWGFFFCSLCYVWVRFMGGDLGVLVCAVEIFLYLPAVVLLRCMGNL